MIKLFLGDSPGYRQYVEWVDEFGSDDILVVAVEADDPLNPRFLRSLRRVVEAIEELPDVASSRSIFSAQWIEGKEDSLSVAAFGDVALENPERREEVLERLRSDRFASGLVVSRDLRDLAVIVELTNDADRAAERVPILVEAILERFTDEGFEPRVLHRAGTPAVFAAIMDESYFNLDRLFPVVALFLLVAVYAMFHRLWPVAITGAVSLIAVIWTMGFAVLLDHQINIMLASVPAVIMIVGFSDVIHLCSAYLLELEAGHSQKQAILNSAADVGIACVLTSVTTLVGFVSLSFVPTPVFRQLGLVLGVGVALALLLAVTLVPIFFSLLPPPKAWRGGTTARVQALLDRVLDWVRSRVTRRPWLTVSLFGAVGLLALVGISRMTIETDMAKRLAEKSQIRVDARYFEERFQGTSTIDLYVEASEAGGLLEPERIAALARYQDAIEALPGVDWTISLVDLLETIYGELHAGTEVGRLPQTHEEIAQLLLLFEMSGGEDLHRFVGFDRRRMRIAVRLNTNAMRAIAGVGKAAEELALRHLPPELTVEANGLFLLMGKWLEEIVSGQKIGVLMSILLIGVMMILGFGSIRVGLWSMIPNILPLFVLGGYLGFAWEFVDSDILMVAMLAIGIGVDDTIHYLMRFRLESSRTDDLGEALERTLHFTGRAIVMTSVILVLGFLPFLASSYLSLHAFGTLLPMVLIVALAADLFLVTALIQLGVIRFSKD